MWTYLHSSTQIKALYLDIASTCQIPAAQGLYWEEMVNNQEKYKVLLAQYVENLYFSKVDDLLNEKCVRENILLCGEEDDCEKNLLGLGDLS